MNLWDIKNTFILLCLVVDGCMPRHNCLDSIKMSQDRNQV